MKLLEGLFNSLKERQMWNLGEIKNKIDNFDSILSSKLLLEGKLLEKGTQKSPEEIKTKKILCGLNIVVIIILD